MSEFRKEQEVGSADSSCRQLFQEVLFQGSQEDGVSYRVYKIKSYFFNRRKKYCLYANGKEAVEGEEEFIEQKKKEVMA